METNTQIHVADIIPGARFRTAKGIVWIVDSVEDSITTPVMKLVRTSMEGGQKGNYCNEISDCVAFLNEQGAVSIKDGRYAPADLFTLCDHYVAVTVETENPGIYADCVNYIESPKSDKNRDARLLAHFNSQP